jgi:hypothetical protein
MTFEEIDACARVLFSRENDISMWPYIDEGDRGYWRTLAIEELKKKQPGSGNDGQRTRSQKSSATKL